MAKKILEGTVVSDKMQKTVVVQVVRKFRHPMYNKIIKKTTKFKADTNGMEIVFGDLVRIEETRPMSKDKYFKVIHKITEKEIKQTSVRKEKPVENKPAEVKVEKGGIAEPRKTTRRKTQKKSV